MTMRLYGLDSAEAARTLDRCYVCCHHLILKLWKVVRQKRTSPVPKMYPTLKTRIHTTDGRAQFFRQFKVTVALEAATW